MRIPDSSFHLTPKPFCSGNKSESVERKLKRNTYIGTAAGIVTSGLLLTKGNLKKLPSMEYGIKEVMTLCASSAVGGYIGANLTTKENRKARDLELKNQLIYNDFLPLLIMGGIDRLYKGTNKLLRSIVLGASLLGGTILGHDLAKKDMKKKGIDKKYPIEPCHLLADADDYLLPIAIATKSTVVQNILKIASPITFFPLGVSVGTVKDKKYF